MPFKDGLEKGWDSKQFGPSTTKSGYWTAERRSTFMRSVTEGKKGSGRGRSAGFQRTQAVSPRVEAPTCNETPEGSWRKIPHQGMSYYLDCTVRGTSASMDITDLNLFWIGLDWIGLDWIE